MMLKETIPYNSQTIRRKRPFSFLLSCFLSILLAASFQQKAHAQPLGNEWINYSRTYYKIPVGNFNTPSPDGNPNNQADKADFNGLRRITKATLDAIGLGNTAAQDFQLWRNGEEVPFYITKSSGLLSASDYIEFWGEANDGRPDLPLFRTAANQINDRWSFFSDTASYFLTVNAGGNNARIADTITNPIASPLTPADYFMYTIRINYRAGRYMGFGMDINDKVLRSSSFDMGEGWGRLLYRTGASANVVLNTTPLYQYENGPLASLKYTIAGDKGINRYVSTSMVNGASDSVVDSKLFLRLSAATYTVNNIPYSRLSKNSNSDNSIKFFYPNGPYDGNDRIYLLKTELTYARRFNFSGANAFLFTRPAQIAGDRFDITATGIAMGFTPYILDLTNRKRYYAIKKESPADTYAFVLGPSAIERKLVFIAGNTANTHFKNIESATVQTTQFTNYSNLQNQADYIIISNKRLFNHNGVNYADKYREYRSSAAGGGYKAKVFDIDSLTDQFAYGIRKNPMAIRNFLKYAQQHFSSAPKYVLLLGHGVTYNFYGGLNQSSPSLEALNLVPTFGHPASDNMLAAAEPSINTLPMMPIGRLSVVNGEEISDYLEKVKAYEQLQSNPDSILWQKNVLHLIGGGDAGIINVLQSYMNYYKNIIQDTLVGANVNTYLRINDPNAAANNDAIQQQVSNGTGLVTYFGHSSSTGLDFSLNDPYELTNTGGKYPMFVVNGCNASEFFTNQPERLAGKAKTLSEKFITAKERGAIAFLSSSHFGVLQYLDIFTKSWYDAAGRKQYAKGIGDIMKSAIAGAYVLTTPNDFYNRSTMEEFILHADPAVKLFTQQKPDYEIDSSNISFTPSKVDLSTDSLTINATIINRGKAVNDSVWIEIWRRIPGAANKLIYKKRLPPLKYSSSISVKIPVIGVVEKGMNAFRVVVDSMDLVDESIETNNTAERTLLISDNNVKTVFPYNYSIVHNWPTKFVANVVDPLAPAANYRIQLDTTQLFNSPLLTIINQASPGNIIEFVPAISPANNTVYYWRISPLVNGIATSWSDPSSFLFLTGSTDGYNQSHYFQHKGSSFNNIILDTDRVFRFDSTKNNLYINQSIYPTSGTEDGHFSITVNGDQIIRSACVGQSILFNVFDSLSFKPWSNAAGSRFGSGINCAPGREYNFEFKYYPASSRKLMMDFLDSIPKGMYVTARLILDPDPGQPAFPTGKADSAYVEYWQNDTLFFGSGQSLYHAFKKQGFYGLDDMTSKRTFAFAFRKDDTASFKPVYSFSEDLYDRVFMNVDFPMLDTAGKILSPWFGPAADWHELHWRLKPLQAPAFDDGTTDSVTIRLYGLQNGTKKQLAEYKKQQQDVVIDTIDAAQYPHLQLEMISSDAAKATPAQLDYWRLHYDPVPEGIINPSKYFEFTRHTTTQVFKDTLLLGQDSLKFGVAFQNVSNTPFSDSIAVQFRLINAAGNFTDIPVKKLKPLIAGDTAKFYFEMSLGTLDGSYNLLVNFNPNRIQKEVMLENNFMYRPFVVQAGSLICPGANSYFVSNINGGTYQWQVDNGNGIFSTLTNTPPYSNVTTNTLHLTAAPSSLYGYKYRCLVNGNTYSKVFTLKFASYWTGAISTAWENAGNWNCGSVPDANTDVYVNSGKTNYPVVSSVRAARSVNLQAGTSVQVASGQQLTITGK
jgi:hypothetical protein